MPEIVFAPVVATDNFPIEFGYHEYDMYTYASRQIYTNSPIRDFELARDTNPRLDG